MAISFGGNGGRTATSGTTLTVSGVSVSGSNTWGSVSVKTASLSDLVTGVTWNGVAMTRVDTRTRADGGGTIYVYALAGVTSGNIVVSTSSSVSMAAHWMYHRGVGGQDATAPANGSGTGSSYMVSFTPTSDGSWMLLFADSRDTPGLGVQAGTGSTKRDTDNDDNCFFDNNAAISPPASTNMTVTQTLSEAFSHIVYAIKPSVAATNRPISNLPLMGVG